MYWPDASCPLEVMKKTKKPTVVEHIHYDTDGNARNVEVHAYPVFDSQGNVKQMIENTVDITEQKRLQEKLAIIFTAYCKGPGRRASTHIS